MQSGNHRRPDRLSQTGLHGHEFRQVLAADRTSVQVAANAIVYGAVQRAVGIERKFKL